jgi:spore germination protein YaaH
MTFAGHKRVALLPVLSLLVFALCVPAGDVFAATSSKTEHAFEYSGWLPYWRVASSTRDVIPNLSQLAEVNPFGYGVKKDGTLHDTAQIGKAEWQALFVAAKKQNVRVVPTIMWSDTEAIDAVLSNKKLRKKHVAAIVTMVENNDFDGVDIDYEGKRASNREHYAAFLKELSVALAKSASGKMLMCTIEARTPPQDLYKTVPPDLEYANDYKAINKYCDRVRLMTYDQQRADLKLNAAAGKELYAPIADVAWVRKVVNLALKDIDKSKLMIGVPTYGYIYQVMPHTDGSGYSYILLEAFNPRYGTDTAREYGITPKRNTAGELAFTYVPKDMPAPIPTNAALSAKAPKGTHSSLRAALGATALAKEKGKQTPFYMLTWSDAAAIEAKVKLARELGLRGIAVFKLDGGQDPALWAALK